MTDILFIKTSSLGDVVHHMPALTEARRVLPQARFAWVVEEAFAPLAALHPAVDEIIPVASRRWRNALIDPATWREVRGFARSLRARRYDEVIDTQGLLRTALIARLARGRRHGYDAASIREPMASRFYDMRHAVERNQHAIARNRTLTGLALGYAPHGAIDFGLDRAVLRGPGRSATAVLLHATARRDKEWPEARWIEIGRSLLARGVTPVLPWGSEIERARSARLAEELPGAVVPPRRPLGEVARLIAGAEVVVGVDTGLLHLAAALGVPLVSIFVGSEPGLTGPKGAGPIATLGGKGACPQATEVLAAIDQVM